MMPVYRSADSYPNHGNQMPLPRYRYPYPYPPMVDHCQPPASCEPWPHGGNYGYPMPCHSCCTHINYPGYYSVRPPYPHLPPYMPMHCSGGHPAYPEAYHVQFVPPPHFTMEQPRYEYDKIPNYHCFGCPNHACHQKENKGVKIEEQEPEVERKKSDSLIPHHSKSYPYQVLWCPQEYMKNREVTPSEPQMVKQEVSRDPEPAGKVKSPEQDRTVWNGWFALDMDSIGSRPHGGQEKRTQSEQNEDERNQLPFPIIWMPPFERQKDTAKQDGNRHGTTESSEEGPYAFKFIPVNLHEKDDNVNQSKGNGRNPEAEGQEGVKETRQSKGSAKQMEPHKQKRNAEDEVKKVQDHVVNKEPGTNNKLQSSFPSKASKLSPFCLRVDPLPKKNGNGSPRSRSPTTKENGQRSSDDTSRTSASSSNSREVFQGDSNGAINEGKQLVTNKKDKIIRVVEAESSENESTDQKDQRYYTQTDGLQMKMEKSTLGTGNDRIQDVEEAKSETNGTAEQAVKSVGAEEKTKKITLSDEEAAMRIQAAYRGFLVRRWEPLKKLKQMTEIRQQLVDVQRRVQALEALSNLQMVDKEILVIGEIIMRLLLKLDTIQGLHPSFRDMRKSLARELTDLLDGLDSIMEKKSKELVQASKDDLPQAASAEIHHCGNKQEQEGEDLKIFGESSSEGTDGSDHIDTASKNSGIQGEEILESIADVGQKKSESPLAVEEKQDEAKIEQPEVEESSVNDRREPPTVNHKGKAEENNEAYQLSLPSEETSKPFSGDIEQQNLTDGENKHWPTVGEENPKEPESEPCPQLNDQVLEGEAENGQALVQEIEEINEELSEHSDSGKILPMSNNNINSEITAAAEEGHDLTLEDSQTENLPATENSGTELPMMTDDDSAAAKSGELEQSGAVEDENMPTEKQAAVAEEGKLSIAAEQVEEPTAVIQKLEESAVSVTEQNQDKNPAGVKAVEELESEEAAVTIDETKKDGEHTDNSDHLHARDLNYNNTEVVAEPADHLELSPAAETGVTEISSEKTVEAENDVDKKETKDGEPTEKNDGQQVAGSMEVDETNETELPEIADHVAQSSEGELKEAPKPGLALGPQLEEEKEEQPLSPSPTASQASDMCLERRSERVLMEENEKLREMMEKLLEAGKQQSSAISDLTGRIKELEKRLGRKRKLRTRRLYGGLPSRSPCGKPPHSPTEERAVSVAF